MLLAPAREREGDGNGQMVGEVGARKAALPARGSPTTGGLNDFSVVTRQVRLREEIRLWFGFAPLLTPSPSWTRRDLTSKDVKTGFGGQNNFRHPGGLRLSKGAHNMTNVSLCY